jgi:hypothetical protein
MDETTATKPSGFGSTKRSRSLWELLQAATLTVFLSIPELAREIVSIETAVIAVGSGLLVGLVVNLTREDAHLGLGNEAITMIVGLVGIGVVSVILWLLIPSKHVSTFLQFVIGFMWGMSLTSVVRHVVLPEIRSSSRSG